MLGDPIASVFMAALVALAYLLCNIYEDEIVAFLSTARLSWLGRREDASTQLASFDNGAFGLPAIVLPAPILPGSAVALGSVEPDLVAVDIATPEPASVAPTAPDPGRRDPASLDSSLLDSAGFADSEYLLLPVNGDVGDAPSPPVDEGSNNSSDSAVTTTAVLILPSPISLTSLSPPASATPNSSDPVDMIPHSPGVDEYHVYSGDGSVMAGWPHQADWVSYEDMFTANIALISNSCAIYRAAPNNPDEIAGLHNATLSVSAETNIDARFILAVIMQESNGCVRVPTSFYSVRNPGLMQSHNGPATCNENGTPAYPCPYITIEEMIREGTAGTPWETGLGLVEALKQANGSVDDVGRYYRAARIYNSGSVDASGNLEAGVATHCYASDVANRLTGWVLAEDGCDGGGMRMLPWGERGLL
ncbi:MAG: hypothetical protein Q9197_005070 [Variospora fuerteventurae]